MILLGLVISLAAVIVGVAVLALGWGYYSAARSLAAALVAPSEVGMLSTLLGLAQSAGAMIAGPALALAFKRGIELDGFWLAVVVWRALHPRFHRVVLSIDEAGAIVEH